MLTEKRGGRKILCKGTFARGKLQEHLRESVFSREGIKEIKMEGMKDKVLVIDDERINLMMAKKTLEKTCEVETAQSGAEGLEKLEKNIPDLILLDIRMPEMDGFEVFSRVKEKYGDKIPVVFLTSSDEPQTEVHALSEGASDFISKPFVPAVMLQRVNRIIAYNRLNNDLANQVEIQIAERKGQMERMTSQIMKTLAYVIDAKDSYTNGHSLRVAKYSREIAKRVGKSDNYQERIYRMGLLHDVGKIGIPDEIINKEGRLTDEEFNTIKAHTVIGDGILKNMTELPRISLGARHHHERYDGKGYPDHLKGLEIPEEARIIAVADAYDAMTSNRSYRGILPQAEVRKRIVEGIGTQFDPEFAKIMVEMIDEDVDYKMNGVSDKPETDIMEEAI